MPAPACSSTVCASPSTPARSASRRHRFEHLRRQHGLEHVGRLQRHQRDVGGREDARHFLARHQTREQDVGQALARREVAERGELCAIPDDEDLHIRSTETQETGGREQRAEVVRHSNRPDVAGQHVVVAQAELGAGSIAVRRLPERRIDPVRHEVQLRGVDRRAA